MTVNLEGVLLESAVVGEGSVAERAKVRADAGVRAQVLLQRVLPSEQLLAHVALVLRFPVHLHDGG